MAGPLLLFAWASDVYAFHEGGVGYCEGCHDLHKSSEGQAHGIKSAPQYMLRGSDPSSVCLRCHAESGKYYNVLSSDGSMYTSGGDFYWLRKTFSSSVNGEPYRSEGDKHGHNVIAVDYGLTEDRFAASAQGGEYSSSAMGCISCHNPHGKTTEDPGDSRAISVSGSYGEIAPQGTTAGNYRLLGGIGYNGEKLTNSPAFNYPAPVAVASSRDWTETDSNHTAYGSGMSEWCGNCHSYLLSGNNKHPSGNNAKLSRNIISNYNSYIKTADITGAQGTAYIALVPFELGATDKSLLDPSSTSGPEAIGKANVMCLTCHRAHASAFPYIGRWDFKVTFISDSHPKAGDGGVSGNDVLNSYYGRNMVAQFGPYQRQLCNKCHLQD